MQIPMLKFFEDPGHGWLEVSLSLLKDLGIEKHISFYSYFSPDKQKAYLEEDCDMSIFFRKLQELEIPEPLITRKFASRNSPVRSLNSYDFGSEVAYL